MSANPNGWNEWSKYVLKALEENNADHEKILTELGKLRTDIEVLKVKAGLWGLAAGAIPVLIAVVAKALNLY